MQFAPLAFSLVQGENEKELLIEYSEIMSILTLRLSIFMKWVVEV